jgi:hypothetical protein
VEATSQLGLKLVTIAAAAAIGIVVAAWRRVPRAVGAIVAIAATAVGTVWFIEDTVGLPW